MGQIAGRTRFFSLQIHLSLSTLLAALISLFLEPKEKVLRRAHRLRGTDGDGVQADGEAMCD